MLLFNINVSFAQQYISRSTLQIDSTNVSDTSSVITIRGNQTNDFITIKVDSVHLLSAEMPSGYIGIQYGDSINHWYTQYPYTGYDTLMDTILIGNYNFRPTHVSSLWKRFFVSITGSFGSIADTLIITTSDIQTNK